MSERTRKYSCNFITESQSGSLDIYNYSQLTSKTPLSAIALSLCLSPFGHSAYASRYRLRFPLFQDRNICVDLKKMSAMKQVNDYGLDVDVANKINSKYDKKLEDEAIKWIEQVSNVTFDKDFGPMLQDGVVLCTLVNSIVPSKIKKINRAGNVYKKLENISSFLRACRELGVAESSLFPANNLAHLQDMNQVLTCIVALSTAIQRNESLKWTGPVMGTKLRPKKNIRKAKKWGNNAPKVVGTRLTQGSSTVMQATKYTNAREMIKTKKMDGGGSGGGTLLNQGSAGVMEATKYSNAREMIKTNQIDGSGTGGGTLLNQGSAGVMEETKYTNAREMIKSNEMDGSGTGGGTLLNQGSAGVMEATKYRNAREMIKSNEMDGSGTGGGTLLNQGSAGVMEETKYKNAREMIKSNEMDGSGSGGGTLLNEGSRATMEETKYKDAREMIKQKEI